MVLVTHCIKLNDYFPSLIVVQMHCILLCAVWQRALQTCKRQQMENSFTVSVLQIFVCHLLNLKLGFHLNNHQTLIKCQFHNNNWHSGSSSLCKHGVHRFLNSCNNSCYVLEIFFSFLHCLATMFIHACQQKLLKATQR